jgi:hypothetical protein
MSDENPYEFKKEINSPPTTPFEGRQGQEPVILPPVVIDKPTSVTVFGVLNCVFGGLGILCTPISIVGIMMPNPQMEIAPPYKIFLLVSSVAGICFAGWLLSLGIGLLKFKGWARRGSVIYACIAIVWCIFGLILSVVAMSQGWMTAPEGAAKAGIIGGMVGGICGGILGMIYPVLLLIFMLTSKVKEAFMAIEG